MRLIPDPEQFHYPFLKSQGIRGQSKFTGYLPMPSFVWFRLFFCLNVLAPFFIRKKSCIAPIFIRKKVIAPFFIRKKIITPFFFIRKKSHCPSFIRKSFPPFFEWKTSIDFSKRVFDRPAPPPYFFNSMSLLMKTTRKYNIPNDLRYCPRSRV